MVSSSSDSQLDEVLEELGQFGTYQLINFLLICIPISFDAFGTISYAFSASKPEYRCKIPNCDNDYGGSYLTPWLNSTVPFKDGLPVSCQRYDWINETNSQGSILAEELVCPIDQFDSEKIIECDEFVFTDNDRTIVNDWNLTCPNNEFYLTIIGSVNNIGQFIGMPLGGFVSDRYGRRFVLVLSVVMSALTGVVKSFSVNYWMFITMEFLDALTTAAIYSASFILAAELLGPRKRLLGLTIAASFYPVGEMILGLVAMWAKDWRLFLRVLKIPGFLIISYIWIIPESIRWLVSQGRPEDVVKILKRAAKINRTPISDDSITRLQKCVPKTHILEETAGKYPLKVALTSRILLLRTLNCSFCWMTNTFVYYGLSLGSVSLAGDKYLNFIAISAVEIPAQYTLYFIMDRIGRRPTQSMSLMLSGIACVAAIFTSKDSAWAGLALFLLGKLAITISFTCLYVYTAELFPTNLRHSLMSFCSMFGRIGSIVAPQTPLMAQFYEHLPLMLFGSCAIVSGLLVLLFPETLNTQLPDTILEAETLGKSKKKSGPMNNIS